MATMMNKVGKASELVAQTKLLENGYTVHEPITTEHHDLLLEKDGVYQKAQVKTIFIREDKGGAMVVFSKKSDGKPYTTSEAQIIIGVLDNREVFLINNIGQKEYWSQNINIAKRKWVHL